MWERKGGESGYVSSVRYVGEKGWRGWVCVLGKVCGRERVEGVGMCPL